MTIASSQVLPNRSNVAFTAHELWIDRWTSFDVLCLLVFVARKEENKKLATDYRRAETRERKVCAFQAFHSGYLTFLFLLLRGWGKCVAAFHAGFAAPSHEYDTKKHKQTKRNFVDERNFEAAPFRQVNRTIVNLFRLREAKQFNKTIESSLFLFSPLTLVLLLPWFICTAGSRMLFFSSSTSF